MLIIQALLVTPLSASHAEIGYKNGLNLSASFELYDHFYIGAESSRENEVYSIGVGHSANSFDFVLLLDQHSTGTGFSLEARYYDLGPPFFFSVGKARKGEDAIFKYKVGAGYPIRENLTLMTHYSDNGLFLGVRKWF